ncbi:hypothetical protein FOZ62_003686, partial [Perkinsus olseni]
DGSIITSHIDVTMCSVDLVERVADWQVDWDDPSSAVSDHAAVKEPPWRGKGRLNEDRFAERICSVLPQWHPSWKDEWAATVRGTASICEAIAQCVEDCRGRSRKLKAPRPVWWTPEIGDLERKVSWLRKRVQRTNNSTETRAELREASRALRRAKRARAKEHARRELASLESPTAAFEYHRKWRAARRPAIHPYLSAEELAKGLFPMEEPDSSEQADMRKGMADVIRGLKQLPPEVEPVSRAELLASAKEVRASSCPGTDSVPVSAMQLTIEREPQVFCEMFTAFLQHRQLPSDLKSGYVITLPKGHDRPAWEVKSWRPITVLTALTRVFERLVYRRVERLIEFPDSFHAYLPGKGCDTAVANLESEIRKIWQNGYSAGCIFLDIEGAFDKCSPWATLKEMKARGLRGDYLVLLSDYLSGRRVSLHHAGDVSTMELTRGTAQGGVLSPWIFNCFMLSLSDVLSPWAYVTYADDAVVIFQYKTEEE